MLLQVNAKPLVKMRQRLPSNSKGWWTQRCVVHSYVWVWRRFVSDYSFHAMKWICSSMIVKVSIATSLAKTTRELFSACDVQTISYISTSTLYSIVIYFDVVTYLSFNMWNRWSGPAAWSSGSFGGPWLDRDCMDKCESNKLIISRAVPPGSIQKLWSGFMIMVISWQECVA